MVRKKRLWVWNIIIVLTILVCLAVFALHLKTYTREAPDKLTLISGFYSSEIDYNEIENISMVPKIPEMERVSGFSVWAVEKGIFRDTIQNMVGIRVYVDDLTQAKIKLEQKNAPNIYFNFKDSLLTRSYFDLFSTKLEENKSKKD